MYRSPLCIGLRRSKSSRLLQRVAFPVELERKISLKIAMNYIAVKVVTLFPLFLMGQKKNFLSLIFKNKKKNKCKLILAQVTFPDSLSRSILGKSRRSFL